MTGSKPNTMHPSRSDLALYAGRDLPRWTRFRVYRHLRNCERCAKAVLAFQQARDSARELAADMPEGLHWEQLASEMTANIRVGLAAGECVNEVPKRIAAVRLGWGPALVFASMAAVMAGGWWLNVPPGAPQRLGMAIRGMWAPRPVVPSSMDMRVSLSAGRDGIEVQQNGSVMTLMNPGASPSVVTASTQGAVRARYVDDDTGQVTITNVYAQ